MLFQNAALLGQFVAHAVDPSTQDIEQNNFTCLKTIEENSLLQCKGDTESLKACQETDSKGMHKCDLSNANETDTIPANIPSLKQHASALLGLGRSCDSLDTAKDCLTADMVGCLLLHHQQQITCNVHAITAIVSTSTELGEEEQYGNLDNDHGVTSREQRRIASAIYPTASLLNHACDPDVIVR